MAEQKAVSQLEPGDIFHFSNAQPVGALTPYGFVRDGWLRGSGRLLDVMDSPDPNVMLACVEPVDDSLKTGWLAFDDRRNVVAVGHRSLDQDPGRERVPARPQFKIEDFSTDSLADVVRGQAPETYIKTDDNEWIPVQQLGLQRVDQDSISVKIYWQEKAWSATVTPDSRWVPLKGNVCAWYLPAGGTPATPMPSASVQKDLRNRQATQKPVGGLRPGDVIVSKDGYVATLLAADQITAEAGPEQTTLHLAADKDLLEVTVPTDAWVHAHLSFSTVPRTGSEVEIDFEAERAIITHNAYGPDLFQ
jgi:hypothetical protein